MTARFTSRTRHTRDQLSRSLGPVGLIAILAMVMAGPTHLWLAHGEISAGCGTHVAQITHTGCHEHACSGHAHAAGPMHGVLAEHDEHPEDRPEPSPCEGSTGDCKTCIALGSAKPIGISSSVDLGELRFLEVEDTFHESYRVSRPWGRLHSRGPPARA